MCTEERNDKNSSRPGEVTFRNFYSKAKKICLLVLPNCSLIGNMGDLLIKITSKSEQWSFRSGNSLIVKSMCFKTCAEEDES
jgi:hypothetical protein